MVETNRLKEINDAFIEAMRNFVDRHGVTEIELFALLKCAEETALRAIIEQIKRPARCEAEGRGGGTH